MTFERLGKQMDFAIAKSGYFAFDFAKFAADKLLRKISEQKNRDQIIGLLKLEDTQLRDMGIERGDIEVALRKPLDVSSGRFLERVRRNNALRG